MRGNVPLGDEAHEEGGLHICSRPHPPTAPRSQQGDTLPKGRAMPEAQRGPWGPEPGLGKGQCGQLSQGREEQRPGGEQRAQGGRGHAGKAPPRCPTP